MQNCVQSLSIPEVLCINILPVVSLKYSITGLFQSRHDPGIFWEAMLGSMCSCSSPEKSLKG